MTFQLFVVLALSHLQARGLQFWIGGLQKELERQVRSFLERDNNSRMNPGKQDCLTVDGEKVQTRILNDYLYILYEKFLAENNQVKMSKSSFYKLRPKHIRHSNCLMPNNCLCLKHENSTLLLRTLKKVLTEPLTPSPDVFVKSYQTEEAVKGLVDKVTATEVTVQQWQRVLDARDGKRRVQGCQYRHATVRIQGQVCARL